MQDFGHRDFFFLNETVIRVVATSERRVLFKRSNSSVKGTALLPQKNSFEGINLLAFARMLDDEPSPQDRCRQCRLRSQACGGCVAQGCTLAEEFTLRRVCNCKVRSLFGWFWGTWSKGERGQYIFNLWCSQGWLCIERCWAGRAAT